jgi:hypothetical protein
LLLKASTVITQALQNLFFFLFFLSKLFIASTFYLKKLAAEDENMTTMQFLAESRKQ